jgi:hypothetical protein
MRTWICDEHFEGGEQCEMSKCRTKRLNKGTYVYTHLFVL